ncbi:MAG: class I SAM-dependent methyltransferase [Calditrichaeota bacterium]|nr:MAG: class I SAM-dependent methyltransferase [Calditrichota bacterium]
MRSHLADKKNLRSIPPYSMLALVYDKMMEHVNYRKWAKYIALICKEEKVWKQGKLLDIGCGTGRFIKEIGRLGQVADGCDPSSDMLKSALKKVPERTFYQCGLPDLVEIPPQSYLIMTCLYDTFNYLMEEEAVVNGLNMVHQKLLPGGLFIFDLVSELHCRQYFQGYYDSEVLNNDYAYSRESFYHEEDKIQYNWIRIYTPEGIFEEEHKQRIYDFSYIHSLITEKTPFTLLHVYDEFSLEPLSPLSGRAHFILKKEGKESN